MNDRTDATLDIVVTIFVLFVAMLDPWVSAGLAIMFLIGLSVYKFVHSDAGRK